jgi:hypothetical protein
MTFSTRRLIGTVLFLGLAAAPMQALAQPSFERPPSFAVEKIPGVWPSGENYTIINPVRSDGLLRIYRLTTPYGEIVVQGDQMLRMRLNELAAVAQLEKIASSESYSKALVAAGLSPIKYTGRLITSPVKTVGDTFQGLGNIFGRVQSDVANFGKTPGGGLAGLLGVTDQRRKLAATVGVDPYTDLAPLDERLSRLSEAAAAGGLTVQAAMLAVPGTAIGLTVSNVSTASTIEGMRVDELARDRTAAQIFDLNRERLRGMGADPELIEALLANRNYTPIDMAVIVAALDGMGGVEDRVVFLRRAAQIDTRSLAYFMRRHAEMLKSHQARGAGLVRFVPLAGYPFNITRDRRLVGIMPIDTLAWTDRMAGLMREIGADGRRYAGAGQAELRITGAATPRAKKELQAAGWRVAEHVKF